MSANTSPLFSLTPNISGTQLNWSGTASPRSDGVGSISPTIGPMQTILVAGNNGTYVSRVRINAVANTPTSENTSVIRIFWNNSNGASGNVTLANNTFLLQEVAVGGLAAANASNALMPIEIGINTAFPSGTCLLTSIHSVPQTNTAWNVVCFAGDF